MHAWFKNVRMTIYFYSSYIVYVYVQGMYSISTVHTYNCILYVYIHYDNLHTVHPSGKIDCTHVTKNEDITYCILTYKCMYVCG